MCGIAGYLDSKCATGADGLRDEVARMSEALASRGPDAAGTWHDVAAGVALGHRRLAIIDLSREGQQPKASHSGRFVVSFNGEIYNYLRLRKQLEELGHAFRSSSDTEVLLTAIEQWGAAEALRRLTGMFAFGLWDRRDRLLTLARDRAGEKPLYYGWNGSLFYFASELKALRANTRFEAQLDATGVTGFLRFGYVPDPLSVYKGIRKLLPGHMATIDPARPGEARVQTYWPLFDVAAASLANPFEGTENEAIDALDTLLAQVVSDQMVADVPRGVFLSGGIDSSLVAAVAQKQSTTPVKTYSIGFDLGGYNEAVHAKAVAQHIGTDHNELYVTASDALAVIPALAQIYDEPFADSSQIPTYLLCKMAREHVTVCLSGEGGDELFGGYNRYLWVGRVWSVLKHSPPSLRRGITSLIHRLSPEAWASMYGLFPRALMPRGLRVQMPGHQLYKLANVISAHDQSSLYHMLLSCWHEPSAVFPRSDPQVVWPGRVPTQLPGRSFTEQMMLSDFETYLPGDVLVKVDRAAMANSLETRVPYVDHRVFEFAWTLPENLRVRGETTKWLLRKVLDRYVPQRLVDRPKMGFAIPVAEWLRGPLRDWAESLLAESALKDCGFLDVAAVRALWSGHLANRENADFMLWAVLMLQDWLRAQGPLALRDVDHHARASQSDAAALRQSAL